MSEDSTRKKKDQHVRIKPEVYEELEKWMEEEYIDTPYMGIKKLLHLVKRKNGVEG